MKVSCFLCFQRWWT